MSAPVNYNPTYYILIEVNYTYVWLALRGPHELGSRKSRVWAVYEYKADKKWHDIYNTDKPRLNVSYHNMLKNLKSMSSQNMLFFSRKVPKADLNKELFLLDL